MGIEVNHAVRGEGDGVLMLVKHWAWCFAGRISFRSHRDSGAGTIIAALLQLDTGTGGECCPGSHSRR